MSNNMALFLSDGHSLEFREVLYRVQEYMSQNYAKLFDGNSDAIHGQIEDFTRQYLQEERLGVPGMETDALVARLYCEMAEYSFLTPYIRLQVPNVEEINVNAWNDTKITFGDGRVVPAPEAFASPQHAIDVFRRLLKKSDINMDKDSPLARGHLNKQIRITVNGPGVIDEDIGIAASIRFVNPQKRGRQEFIESGMATNEMLDFLAMVFRYKESVVLAGETGTGKTTVMSWLLSTVPDWSRVYTVENGTREFDLVKHDKNGNVLNNVIQTVTHDSKNKDSAITQQKLLEQGLTFNPDYIAMAEVKGDEAFVTCEAARTGHGVVSTIHAKSLPGIYARLVELCQMTCKFSGEMLYTMAADAFPIAFFIRKGQDNIRRITEIGECEILPGGGHEIHPLWQWRVKRRYVKHGKTVEDGYFEKTGEISAAMRRRLCNSGMPDKELLLLMGEEEAS